MHQLLHNNSVFNPVQIINLQSLYSIMNCFLIIAKSNQYHITKLTNQFIIKNSIIKNLYPCQIQTWRTNMIQWNLVCQRLSTFLTIKARDSRSNQCLVPLNVNDLNLNPLNVDIRIMFAFFSHWHLIKLWSSH